MNDRALRQIGSGCDELWQLAIGGCIRCAEEHQVAHFRTVCLELSRKLECDRSTGTEAGDRHGAVRAECADLVGEIFSEAADRPTRLASFLVAGRLQAIEGLVAAEMPGDGAVAEDIAVVPGHGKYRNAAALCDQRDESALLRSELLGSAQEVQISCLRDCS